MKYNLSGKTILIIGATGGLGTALALQLTQIPDTRLVLAGRSPEKLEDLQQKLQRQFPNPVSILPIELSQKSLLEPFCDEIKRLGVDGVICSNGVTVYRPFTEADPSEYENLLQVNWSSVIRCASELLPYLRERDGFFHIVGSHGSFLPVPYQALYAASKAALYSFVVSVSAESGIPRGLLSISFMGGMKTNMYYQSGLQKRFSRIESLFVDSPDRIAASLIKGLQKRKILIPIKLSGRLMYAVLRHFPVRLCALAIARIYRPADG